MERHYSQDLSWFELLCRDKRTAFYSPLKRRQVLINSSSTLLNIEAFCSSFSTSFCLGASLPWKAIASRPKRHLAPPACFMQIPIHKFSSKLCLINLSNRCIRPGGRSERVEKMLYCCDVLTSLYRNKRWKKKSHHKKRCFSSHRFLFRFLRPKFEIKSWKFPASPTNNSESSGRWNMKHILTWTNSVSELKKAREKKIEKFASIFLGVRITKHFSAPRSGVVEAREGRAVKYSTGRNSWSEI